MSTQAALTLDRHAAPWLFATALAATLPHVLHQPAWVSAAGLGLFAAAGWLWWRNLRLPGRWLLVLCVALATTGILLQYRTLFGREPGVAMLFLFMALKLLELRQRRDALVVVHLGFFLLLTHFFDAESIFTGLWLLGATLVVTAALVRLHGGSALPLVSILRHAGLMLAQALPLMVALYLLFPRVAGPLWGLPQDAHGGRTGLPEQMAPGSVANLALNTEIAFRVRFAGPLPDRNRLYWRGPVMDDFDGSTWRQPGRGGPAPAVETLSAPVSYEMTMEPLGQRWLLALDAPVQLPPEAGLSSGLSLVARQPALDRRRYRLASALDYRFNTEEDPAVLQRALRLPAASSPRTRALAESWRREESSPEALVRRALAHFRERDFVYTLQPPSLPEQPVDGFLFDTRRGFCEHFAGAFTVLMRAAGIPARVVGGYQGGEVNPVDGYLVVRHSDAHAWSEVWLAGRGWVRVDPTAAVSPSRIERGIASAVPAGDPLPGLLQANTSWLRGLRYRWEAMNNTWNQWVLGYNPLRQRELFSRLGLEADWQTLASLLVGAVITAMLGLLAWALYRRPRLDAAEKLWRRALRRLARRGVRPLPGETPLALAGRLRRERPDLAAPAHAAALAYGEARYGRQALTPAALRTLREALARLP